MLEFSANEYTIYFFFFFGKTMHKKTTLFNFVLTLEYEKLDTPTSDLQKNVKKQNLPM